VLAALFNALSLIVVAVLHIFYKPSKRWQSADPVERRHHIGVAAACVVHERAVIAVLAVASPGVMKCPARFSSMKSATTSIQPPQ